MLDDALPSAREYGDPLLLASLLAARAEAAWLAGDLDRTATRSEGGALRPSRDRSRVASGRAGVVAVEVDGRACDERLARDAVSADDRR